MLTVDCVVLEVFFDNGKGYFHFAGKVLAGTLSQVCPETHDREDDIIKPGAHYTVHNNLF